MESYSTKGVCEGNRFSSPFMFRSFYLQYVFWAYLIFFGIYLIFYWSVLRIWNRCFDFLFHFYVILLYIIPLLATRTILYKLISQSHSRTNSKLCHWFRLSSICCYDYSNRLLHFLFFGFQNLLVL